MRVSVTGGAGFIGKYVCETLRAHGHDVIVFDHHRDRVDLPLGCDFMLGDVRDATAVTELAGHSDAIIHLAAVLGTQETIRNPRPAAESNIVGGLNVLEACAQYQLPMTYIGVGNHWMQNSYSISKTCVERYCSMFNADRGGRVNVVRAMNAYGPRQTVAAPFGPARVRKITPSFVCRALCGMDVEVYGDGSQVSDMVHVADVAEALVCAVEAAARDDVFDGVVEVGPTDHATVLDIAELVVDIVSELADVRSKIVHLPMRPGENIGDRVIANTSSLALVNMNPDKLRTLVDGMEETVAWFADNEDVHWRRPSSGNARSDVAS